MSDSDTETAFRIRVTMWSWKLTFIGGTWTQFEISTFYRNIYTSLFKAAWQLILFSLISGTWIAIVFILKSTELVETHTEHRSMHGLGSARHDQHFLPRPVAMIVSYFFKESQVFQTATQNPLTINIVFPILNRAEPFTTYPGGRGGIRVRKKSPSVNHIFGNINVLTLTRMKDRKSVV